MRMQLVHVDTYIYSQGIWESREWKQLLVWYVSLTTGVLRNTVTSLEVEQNIVLF